MTRKRLTHLDESGAAHMVDVSTKDITKRSAKAKGHVAMSVETRDLLLSGGLKKGDAIATARIAGIMAAKNTASLIPLCHPLSLSRVSVDIEPDDHGLTIVAEVGVTAKTGVEMEALTAVSVAALTIYDMAKALERSMRIGDIRLVEKSGGASGDFLGEE